ncbi:Putative hem peroxidase superfamily, hem peroxidase, animal-type [Septoria linicola]|uniref:Hem peroxidase superfamily, hem peroxidase, animal-type n=1 Tax=Septoria linicola TaxID=215465 RepID=A0A9Q9EEP0_9PEZI|nr:Putative hem peroxidase superfamily, hem peroxidase, animal-type [Septoria linicola]
MGYSFGQLVLIALFKTVNAIIPWHRLPPLIGALNLLALRDELREKNLFDTYPTEDFQGTPKSDPVVDTKFICARNSDGLFNDLDRPKMGCRGMRFGRNVPRRCTESPSDHDLMTPDPRLVSAKLLQRTEFKPATIVNLLAAAWIQFQVHDWAQHTNSTTQFHEIKLRADDPWLRTESSMKVAKTEQDEPLDEQDQKFAAYKNENTHWWDASQIYGSSEVETRSLRSKHDDGTMDVDRTLGEQFLPRGPDGIPKTGFNNNWWLGLELLHTLFALEHNAICSMLKTANPSWTGDEIFDVARLINCALMAKIHTIEWTPAILPHPTLDIGMNANWSGLLGPTWQKLFSNFGKNEAFTGIPESGTDSGRAPYCLTEEFVSVYRLHSLIPDDVAFFKIRTGEHAETVRIEDIAFENARSVFDKGLGFTDAFYSFGINFPGAITAHNMPSFLHDLKKPDGEHLDMGCVDVLRDRERGVPRYCQFRRLFHMPAPKNFEALTGNNKTLAAELSQVYDGDVEKVDLLVGCLCEPLPKGFGFSDTAFRVFILMASRRLKSDRFIASDFKDEIYTREGISWVQDNDMRDVLVRHFPDLRVPLKDVKNAFAPWGKVGRTVEYKGHQINAPA